MCADLEKTCTIYRSKEVDSFKEKAPFVNIYPISLFS